MSEYVYLTDDGNPEYSYFSIEAMTRNLKITESAYEKAWGLIHQNQAVLQKIEFGYSKWGLCGELIARIHEKYTVAVRFTREQISQIYCHVRGCSENHPFYNSYYSTEICEHKAAALILLKQYIQEYRPGDCTDLAASHFLMHFRYGISHEEDSRIPSVTLLPKLEGKNNLNLKLLITDSAFSRNYIIRNIPELFQTVSEHGILSLGKKNQIDFSVSRFTEQSSEFISLLKSWMIDKEMQNDRSGRSYFYHTEEMKNDIWLYGERLDRFFELFCGQKITYDNKLLTLKEDNPRLKLNIRKMTDESGDHFEGIIVSGELPVLCSGSRYVYCMLEDSFCRMSPDYLQKISPLLSLTEFGEDIYFCIGRKNLAEFYYRVLPVLRQTVEIQEFDDELIEQYLPPEVFFRFYLDVDNGVPECRVETRYGETGVAVFDQINSPILKEAFRDAYREKQVLDTVLQYFPHFQREQERFLADEDPDSIYTILENALPLFMQMGDVQSTQRFQNMRIRRKLGISIGVSIDSDLLNLDIMTKDIPQSELLEIIKSYRKKKTYHRLKSGEFVNMDESIAELSALLDTMHISPKEFVKGKIQLPAYRALYLDKMLEQVQEIYAKRDSHYKQLIKNFKTVKESDFEVPESLRQIMRSYQRFGHKWLRTLEACGFGGILADDMGLGKTLQMISVLLAAKEEGISGTSLIICPASLIYNWAAEFEKFAPSLNVCPVAGTAKDRQNLIENYQQYDVLITSYDFIKRDTLSYDSCEFLFQVLDEAQYIKNHHTAASKSVKLIHAEHRFALTGTPIENRLSELWSIFDFLMPGFLYGYETFKKEFETPIVKKSDQEAAKHLRRMTSPFILRRMKQDVLRDLPEKLEEEYIVHLEEEQRHVYDAKVLELRQMLESENDESYQNSKLKVLAMLTQIRQICCDPSLLYEDYTGESAKKSACMEIISRAIDGGHKILIFSQFTSMLDLLEDGLIAQNISFFKITGETSKKKRLELVDAFNKDNTPVFLISLKAGGTGLNLTGADIVIHYDPWWNVAAQNQATDRAHRIGQDKTVTVYKLITKHTIEERIQKMQNDKQKLADSVLTGETVNLSSLSKDELLNILQ